MADPKKDALLIAFGKAKASDKPEKSSVNEDADEHLDEVDNEMLDTAVEDFMKAFEEKDNAGVRDALKNFFDLCN